MKSTTIRFSDPVYADLEATSRLTGLPINSIVTVACMEWLRRSVTAGDVSALAVPALPMRPLALRQIGAQMVQLSRAVPSRRAIFADQVWVFTTAAQEALARAKEAAERTHRPWIGTSHLLQGLAEVAEGRAARALARLGVDAVALTSGEAEEAGEQAGRLLPSRQVRRVLRRAQDEADAEGAAQIGTDHLLLALLLERDNRVAEALAAAGITEAAARDALEETEAEE